MPPIKFRRNPTYWGNVIWRISSWPRWWPSLISEQNDFHNSESQCRSDASHQVSAQSDLRFRRRCRWKNFKMATFWHPSWISEQNNFSNSEYLSPRCLSSFWLSLTYGFRRRRGLKNFNMAAMTSFLDISDQTNLATVNFYVAPTPTIKFLLNPIKDFGEDVVWRISRWLPERYNFSNFEFLCHCYASHQLWAQSD